MDSFTDQISKNFYGKEWLVKLDNSRPYLFKFHASSDSTCSVILTDTVNVWFEVLDTKQLARRWRRLNDESEPFVSDLEEMEWRSRIAQKLASMHTMKVVQGCLFSIENSRDADLAFELSSPGYKWRWECCSVGPKTSADVLSKHLILPLLSIAHLAFTSADSVSELSTSDLENAVDKLARTGRRAQDIHVRQTLSRPRVATTLARLTAAFNFADATPSIISELDEIKEEVEEDNKPTEEYNKTGKIASPSFKANSSRHAIPSSPPAHSHTASRQKHQGEQDQKKSAGSTLLPPAPVAPEDAASGSATESDSDDEPARAKSIKSSPSAPSQPADHSASDSDSGNPRPPPSKKTKHAKTDSDSDLGSGGGAARQGSKPPVRSVGVRQPMKRGGRKF